MRLRTGVTSPHALKVLRELVDSGLGNVVWHNMPDSYLEWVETAETQLRNLFADDVLANGLQNARYFHIRQLTPDAHRPAPLISAEIALQKSRLTQASAELNAYAALAERPGHPLVLDTNVFLHSNLFTEIDWAKEFNYDEQVRLIVPLIVLDELDDKTFSQNKQIAKRADKVLVAFDKYMETVAADEIAIVREGVSLEILRDDVSHQRRTSNDSEIIDRAEFLQQVIEKPVTMVTGDRGLRVRCHARGIPIFMMPVHLRWPLYEESVSI